MILSALGVSRDDILKDYHLSTSLRRPENEIPKIDVVAQADNPVAMLFAKYQQNPAAAQPKPLYSADHKAFLTDAFEEIEAKWGSVNGYLEKEAGISAADIATLRANYLE
jgi:protein-tyrosine phosphatase